MKDNSKNLALKSARPSAVEVKFAKPVSGIKPVWVRRVVSRALKMEKTGGYLLSVYVTDNQQIRIINREYLKHDYATDVISFWLGREPVSPARKRVLGEIVVSAEMARQTGKSLGILFREELARYLVHGVLHLLGYDDKKPQDQKKMHQRQEELLRSIL